MPLVTQQGHGAHCRSLPVSFLCHSTSALDISGDESHSRKSSRSPSAKVGPPSLLPPLRYSFAESLPSPPSPIDMLPHQQHSLAQHRSDEQQPIHEREWVQIFSEILRHAKDQNPTVKPASTVLYDYIRENHVHITWEDITLPGGRSLSSYRHAYNEFHVRGPEAVYPMNPMKRQLTVDAQTPIGRTIAPKPLPGPSAALRGFGPAQQATLMSPMGGTQLPQPVKKRGRPSKKEQEARRQRQSEAASSAQPSRGSGPSETQTGLSSLPQSPVAPARAQQKAPEVSTPQGQARPASNTNSSSSGKKRRGRPPKSQSHNAPPPPFNPHRDAVDTPQSSRQQRTSDSPTNAALNSGIEAIPRGSRGADAPHWKDHLLNNER